MNGRWLTDATAQPPGLRVERSPRTDPRGKGDRTRRLSDHFAEVSARYRALRELDREAVRIIGDVVARAADPGRAVRLLDVATGSGRYLDAVSQRPQGDFVEWYLLPLLYPAGLTRADQVVLGCLVVAVNVAAYGWLWSGRRSARRSIERPST